MIEEKLSNTNTKNFSSVMTTGDLTKFFKSWKTIDPTRLYDVFLLYDSNTGICKNINITLLPKDFKK